MSGIDGIGGVPPSGRSCRALVIDTFISSPKPKVVSILSVGAVLEVRLGNEGGLAVIQVAFADRVAGGLTSPTIQALRRCMEDGVEYQAKVTNISGGDVRVRVTAK